MLVCVVVFGTCGQRAYHWGHGECVSKLLKPCSYLIGLLKDTTSEVLRFTSVLSIDETSVKQQVVPSTHNGRKSVTRALPCGPEVWLPWLEASIASSMHLAVRSSIKNAEYGTSKFRSPALQSKIQPSESEINSAVAPTENACPWNHGGPKGEADNMWLTEWPVQVLLVALNVVWTSRVEKALQSFQPSSLAQLRDQYSVWLDQLVLLVRKQSQPVARLKLEASCMSAVNARDATAALTEVA